MIRKSLQVKLGKNSYPIYIGDDILKFSGKIVSLIGDFSRVIIVTDKNIEKLHLAEVKNSFQTSYKNVNVIIIPPGEKTKSFYYLNFLLNQILKMKVDRQSLLVALGGGVIGDLIGLVSSLLLRGIPYVQIPTTLLAQVDSAVGGKTAINTTFGKNLIGTFKQPIAVISSINILQTLKKRAICSGYAEILKYSLIKDKEFFFWLDKNGKKLINLDFLKLKYAIKKSCEIKSSIVAEDEKESGIRALLNLGHTFGHVIETLNNYSQKVQHGEAVLIGMILAVKLSISLNLCNSQTLVLIEKHYEKLKLKYRVKDFKIKTTTKEFVNLLHYDKKVKKGKINFILLQDIGSPIIIDTVKRIDLNKLIKKEIDS